MIGLVLSLIFFFFNWWLGGDTMEAAFVSSAGFLYHWYLVWSIIGTVIVFLTFLFPTLVLSILSGTVGGTVGALAGFTLGTMSIVVVLRYIMHQLLFVIGAYLLIVAGTQAETFSQFDLGKLVVGIIFIVIAVSWRKRK